MAEEYYMIPEDPQYRAAAIRKLQDSDPASARQTFNPLVASMLESVDYLYQNRAPLDENGKVPEENLPALGGHIAQAEPPENKNLLWIDTGSGGVLKHYDPESEAWTQVEGTPSERLYGLVNGVDLITPNDLAASDLVPLADASEAAGKKLTLANLMQYINNRTTRVQNSNSAYGTYMARAIAAGTADLTAGTSTLESGNIYLVYE